MGLSLNASKKSIQTLFDSGELQYVIPYFQRSYSWEYAQVYQMYTDVVNAYRGNEEYFLGNILLAISERDSNTLQIIDGQQRLLTIWLMLKVMSSLLSEHSNLSRLIFAESLFKSTNIFNIRIGFQLEESDDFKELKEVSRWSEEDMRKRWIECSKNEKIVERLCPHLIEANCLYLYSWLSEYRKDAGDAALMMFLKNLLDNVYLLPIEMSGSTTEEAISRALKIYESMNNRGMNLSDADIFKARLYAKASRRNEEKKFIDQWVEISNNCIDLTISIDEVFRYYMHILRGEKGVVSGETSLRDFFSSGKNAPLDMKDYTEVMSNLSTIIEILRRYSIALSSKEEIAKWLRVIDWYSNQYPKVALVAYIYHHGVECFDEKEFLRLTKSLIRYCYGMGSTTVVKFEIYNIIKQVSQGITFSDYFDKDVAIDNFYYLGALKKGFALLTYHIRHKDMEASNYYCDRLFKGSDMEYMRQLWSEYEVDSAVGDLANYYIRRKEGQNWVVDEKTIYEYMITKPSIRHEEFITYSKELKQSLVDFFKGEL